MAKVDDYIKAAKGLMYNDHIDIMTVNNGALRVGAIFRREEIEPFIDWVIDMYDLPYTKNEQELPEEIPEKIPDPKPTKKPSKISRFWSRN